MIDAFITVLLPLLWYPSFLLSCPARYYIIEDIGPLFGFWVSWPGFLLNLLPTCLASVAMGIFSVLALLSHLELKRKEYSNPSFMNASVRTRKLLFMSFTTLLLLVAAFGVTLGKTLHYIPVSTWETLPSMAENIHSLQVVRFLDRYFLDTLGTGAVENYTLKLIITPLLGIYIFAWFGFTAEAQNSYRRVIGEFARLVRMKPEDISTQMSETGWKPINFDHYQIPGEHRPTPHLGASSNSCHDMHLPSEPARAYRLGHSNGAIKVKPEESIRLPIHLSCHKLPLVPLGHVDAPHRKGYHRYTRPLRGPRPRLTRIKEETPI